MDSRALNVIARQLLPSPIQAAAIVHRKTVVAGCHSGNIWLIEIEGRELGGVREVKARRDIVLRVVVARDGSAVATASVDRSCKIWSDELAEKAKLRCERDAEWIWDGGLWTRTGKVHRCTRIEESDLGVDVG
jgi:hypothetical protein